MPSGDFSLYDHVLDAACMLGAIPPGYGWAGGAVRLPTLFTLARGSRGTEAEQAAGIAPGLPALEMTKWFDTNYHYLVPRLSAEQRFQLTENRPLAVFREAQAAGSRTRPVLLGPVILPAAIQDDGRLRSARPARRGAADLCPGIARTRRGGLRLGADGRASAGTRPAREGTRLPSRALTARSPEGRRRTSCWPATSAPLGDNLGTAIRLPVAGLHLDLVRGASDLDGALETVRPEQWLSLGLVDGRNVWRTDLRAALATAQRVAVARGGTRRLMVAPSCSLLHVPVDLAQEAELDPEIKGWLAFATQKLGEVAALARGLDKGEAAIRAAAGSERRGRAVAPCQSTRAPTGGRGSRWPRSRRRWSSAPARIAVRRAAQQARLEPARLSYHHDRLLPANSRGAPRAGSARARRDGRGRVRAGDREAGSPTLCAGRRSIGLDVLVHGEFERNDMVKYFGEQLSGYAFTQHGWVQSYGSRCVAPADHLGRRLAPGADDGALVRLRAVAHGSANEGHADRPGDHAAMVLRARRRAARDGLPADRARDP